MAGLKAAGAVQLLCASVACSHAAAVPVADWMSPAEEKRLASFALPWRRAQFIAGRWQVRRLLRLRLGAAAASWQLSAPMDGPPQLVGPAGAPPLYASLSHSGDQLACAVADVPVGIDVEAARVRQRDWPALAQAVCCAAEWARFRQAPAGRQAQDFHALWTLKEAWLKAHGQGMTPGRMARLHTVAVDRAAVANAWLWQGPDVTLALVAPHAMACEWPAGRVGQFDPLTPGRWSITAA